MLHISHKNGICTRIEEVAKALELPRDKILDIACDLVPDHGSNDPRVRKAYDVIIRVILGIQNCSWKIDDYGGALSCYFTE